MDSGAKQGCGVLCIVPPYSAHTSLCHPFLSWDTAWISTVLLKISLHVLSDGFFIFLFSFGLF